MRAPDGEISFKHRFRVAQAFKPIRNAASAAASARPLAALVRPSDFPPQERGPAYQTMRAVASRLKRALPAHAPMTGGSNPFCPAVTPSMNTP